MKTLIDIVSDGLEKNGFDGLFNECGECVCKNSDLSPGSCFNDSCEPAYLHEHSTIENIWVMSRQKTKLSDEEIEEINGLQP